MDTLTRLAEFGPITILSLVALVAIWRNNKKVEELGDNHLHEVKEILDRLERTICSSQDEQSRLLHDIKTSIEIIRVKMNGK